MTKAATCLDVWFRNYNDRAKEKEALALYARWEIHPLFGNPPRVLLILVTVVASATLASTMAVGIEGSHGTMGLSAEDVHTAQKFAVVAGMKGGMTVLAIAALCVAQCGNDMEKVRAATDASEQKFNKGTRKGAKWKATADFLNAEWKHTPFNKLYLVPELPKVPELPEVPQVLKTRAFLTVSPMLDFKKTTNDPKTTNARASMPTSPPNSTGNMDAKKKEPNGKKQKNKGRKKKKGGNNSPPHARSNAAGRRAMYGLHLV
eukprot:scaffold57598_cov59-Phaeocystis_antarctica.AAC.1